MSHAPFDLSERVALVTGATKGLGREIAKGLAQAGAKVWLNGRDHESLAKLVNEIRINGGIAEVIVFDITDNAAMSAAFANLKQLDILVNNVGQRNRNKLEAFQPTDFHQLLETNLIAAFELARLSVPLMRARSYGRIINITSIAGNIARSDDVIYTASKGGLDGLTKALAAELGRDKITVNAIAPGFFATEANVKMAHDKELNDYLAKRTSLGRWGEPNEIAGAAVFLASPAAAYITGHTLAVDGGYLSHF